MIKIVGTNFPPNAYQWNVGWAWEIEGGTDIIWGEWRPVTQPQVIDRPGLPLTGWFNAAVLDRAGNMLLSTSTPFFTIVDGQTYIFDVSRGTVSVSPSRGWLWWVSGVTLAGLVVAVTLSRRRRR